MALRNRSRFSNKVSRKAAKQQVGDTSPLSDADLQLLTQIGFSAVIRGMDDEATIIFKALDAWAPSSAAAAIGFALSALLKGNFDRAISVLKSDGINKDSSGAEAKAVLLIALQLSGRLDEAESLKKDLARFAGPAQQFAALFS